MRGSRQRAALLGACIAIGLALAAAMSLLGGKVPGISAQATPGPINVTIIPNPTTGATVGQPVTFTAVATGGTGNFPSFTWVFSDSSTQPTSGQTVQHTFATSGTYQVTVIVRDSDNNTGYATINYTVGTGTTTGTYSVTIQATPTNPNVNESVTFTAFTSGTVPSDAVYTWNFGDNTATTTGTQVSHIYSAAGTYTVTLQVTSATSPATNQTATLQLTVGTPAPSYTLAISGPTTATVGQSVTYSATVASGTAPSGIAYTWNFGDGGTATGQSVTHTFSNAGTYTVSLTGSVGNSGTGTQTASLTVTVSGPTGPTVTYQAGWNLVAGPAGTVFSQADGPLYNYPAGATAYVQVPNTQGVAAGQGYWAFFFQTTTVALSGTSSTTASITAPAGQFVMIGNPSATQTLTVRGADVVYTYSPTSNSYTTTTTLAPGQGAWVYSANGATVTVGP